MKTKLVATDGHVLECWQVQAIGKKLGGLVILQEIFGITDQLKTVAQRYAALGYDVAVPALFDRHEPGTVVPFDQGQTGLAVKESISVEDSLLDIDSAINELGTNTAVLGFCWGGGLAIRAAQKLKVVGSVAFYGTGIAEFLDCPLNAPVLGHFGVDDGHVPLALLTEIRAYFPELQVHEYQAGHAFANDQRSEFVPAAADLAHSRTANFLAKYLSGNTDLSHKS